MLRQIKWWLQNRTITKNGVLLVTNLLFWKFYFSLITSYEELICCINNPNSHICTFCKHWSFCAFTLWVSLRELIFEGIDFHEFYKFLTILRKLVSAKIIGGCATREIRENYFPRNENFLSVKKNNFVK